MKYSAERVDTGITVEAGKLYLDGHGDTNGPMELRDGVWLNQHGALYYDNGIQRGHVPGSAGNLLRESLRENTSHG